MTDAPSPREAVSGNSLSAAISVRNLGKTFVPPAGLTELLRGRWTRPPVVALTDVSFQLAHGEIACLMGANGAGKSTLLRVLAGILVPSTGSVTVAGMDAAQAASRFRTRVAFVVGDERSFHWGLSGRHNLDYFAALHGHSFAEGRRRTDALLAHVGLSDAADRLFRTYSRGMRQRLALARGLLGDAEVLLLDEPTLGLDPEGARDLRRFLRDEVIRGAGRTALIGTNDPGEARALGDRVLFLERGRLRRDVPSVAVDAEFGL